MNWINVNTELPKNTNDVLVSDGENINIGNHDFNRNGGKWAINGTNYFEPKFWAILSVPNREIEEINQANISHIEAANELCKQKYTEIIALTKQLEEAKTLLQENSKTLYDLMNHCVEQRFIDFEDETDGILEYKSTQEKTVTFLSTLKH